VSANETQQRVSAIAELYRKFRLLFAIAALFSGIVMLRCRDEYERDCSTAAGGAGQA
jgi:hypothetical protein